MRRLLLLTLLPALVLAGCKTAPLRPMPAASWTRGAAAWVRFDSQHNAFGMAAGVKRQLDEDLQSAGFRLDQPAGGGQLDVALSTDDDSAMAVSLSRDGERLEQYTLQYGDLPCNQFPHTNLDVPCIAREIGARLVDSRARCSPARTCSCC
jgi:hypothetical protein